MTVAWSLGALNDRKSFLDAALERAIEVPDPQIYAAAEEQDSQLEMEGNVLDGAALYAEGPVSGTRLYPCKSGKYVMIYTRVGNQVDILWIAPSRSNWKPTSQPFGTPG